MNIKKKIQNFIDPISGLALFQNSTIEIQENNIKIHCPFALQNESARLEKALQQELKTPIIIEQNIKAHRVQEKLSPLKEIKNIIAIASGKGGVGKSTISINLALALKAQGANVGLLDADIYGPSQALMLGGAKRPESKDGKSMEPIIRHGIQSISIGDLVDENTAMIWRGPMVTQTLIQLLRECNWKALDYLIIDLPPGTGDTQLTLAQTIPVAGAIIVSTPQDIALLDAKRAKAMFDKVNIPTLGIVENMSVYRCPNCNHESHIFGEKGAQTLAKKSHLPLLAELPLDIEIRKRSDEGKPIVLQTENPIAERFHLLALRTGYTLSQQKTQDFPKIIKT